ncbi:MAG: hypothetical protein ABJM06_12810 [Gilvibacter sp.]
MKVQIRAIKLLLIVFLLSQSCSLVFSPSNSLDLSDFQELLDLPIASPTDEEINVQLEDPNKIIVYHGFACGQSDRSGTEDIIRLQGRLDVLPSYVNNATIILNGWNSNFLGTDHHIAAFGSGIVNINYDERENELTWDAFGAMSDKNFDDAYSWCYYYTVIAWNDNQVGVDVDQNDVGNLFYEQSSSSSSVMNLENEMEVFQGVPSGPVAILPRGYGVIKQNDDFHYLQYGYHLDAADDLTSPVVNWNSTFIFKDDDADDEFDVFEMVSAAGGTDVGVVKQSFELDKWDDDESGFEPVESAQSTYVVEEVPYEYAIPMLTGWDLYFPQDEHVQEAGIWIDNFTYELGPDKGPGTLTYNLSSVLKDKNNKPKHAMGHNITILGIKGVKSRDSPITVTGPRDNILVSAGTELFFDSSIKDGEGINDRELEWHSSIDGLLGRGKSIMATLSGPKEECNPPYVNHKITIKVRSDTNIEVSPINIKVGSECE